MVTFLESFNIRAQSNSRGNTVPYSFIVDTANDFPPCLSRLYLRETNVKLLYLNELQFRYIAHFWKFINKIIRSYINHS